MQASMADQYSGNMLIGLDDLVSKTVRSCGFPQHGVFTLDMVPHFSISDWVPLVLLACLSEAGINGSKATGTDCLMGDRSESRLRTCRLPRSAERPENAY